MKNDTINNKEPRLLNINYNNSRNIYIDINSVEKFNELIKEEIVIFENIIKELEYDKNKIIKEPIEDNKKNYLKLKKKSISIEVNENIEDFNFEQNNLLGYKLLEVKNKIFKSLSNIEKQVLYEGKQYNLDRHQPADYLKINNYR